MDAVIELVVVGGVAGVAAWIGAHFGLKRRVRITVPLPMKPHKHDLHIAGKRQGEVVMRCVVEGCTYLTRQADIG